MSIHLKKIAAFIAVIFPFLSSAQNPQVIDSLYKQLVSAKTAAEKLYYYDNLSRVMMSVDSHKADSLGNELILCAEESRDRELMVRAYMSNGLRCSYFRGQKTFTKKSIEHYSKAFDIAKENKLDKYTGAALLQLAEIHLFVPDKDRALKLVEEGYSRIVNINDDSLLVSAHTIYGKVYLSRNEKILALRHYLTGLRIAEEINAKTANEKRLKAELKRNCFLGLSGFYSEIEDYDRSIDYHTQAYQMLDYITDKRAAYQRVTDISTIGNLFSEKKNYDIAIRYFERSIAMADSLKFENLKVPAYVSLLNQYIRMEQPQKALDYVNSADGVRLKKYLNMVGMSGVIDQIYGFVYTESNRFDSAKHYFEKAIPFFEKRMNAANSMSINLQYARMFEKSGDNKNAIINYLKVIEAAKENGRLDLLITATKHLDSVYERSGDFRNASIYTGMYYKFKDSSENLNKEKELAQVEAADEQQRLARQLKEEQERKKRKNNIQYMSIIIGIIVLFIALVILGMFKVSATVIKAIGFFVFLLLFEFVFLVFKKNIYSITEGEPWKDLAFMIMLAALLVPLHHWLEHKVLHYLTSHNRLTLTGHRIKKKLFGRSPTV